MVVAEECGGGSEVPSRLVPLGVEGCGVVAEGTFVGEFRGSAMETRGVDTADGVVGLHGGIERAVGVEGGDAPFAAEIYGGCSSAQEATLVGRAMGAQGGGGAPECRHLFAEMEGGVHDQSLAEGNLKVADDERAQPLPILKHHVTAPSIIERVLAVEDGFAAVLLGPQAYVPMVVPLSGVA